jgi:hypothetical protein
MDTLTPGPLISESLEIWQAKASMLSSEIEQ